MTSKKHSKRIRDELKAAGMTAYGFMKLETDYLPEIIHTDEHIKAVVYGRLEDTIDSVMLVATDKRVLYIDCKPFYKNYDEITYEVVAGVKMSVVGPFASIILHNRVKDYSLRYVNKNCAHIFTEYIENYIEQAKDSPSHIKKQATKAPYQPYRIEHDTQVTSLEEVQLTELIDDTAILSTVDNKNNPHASVVHFEVDKDDNYYILTKKDTQKSRNIANNNNVALTIHQSQSLKVLYIYGVADEVLDHDITSAVYSSIAKVRAYREGDKLAPITAIAAGDYVVYKITPSSAQLDDYSTVNW